MELFKTNVVTINTPPNEIYYQLKGLWEQLYPDYADMSQESPETLSKGLINVNTGKSVSHLLSIVERNYLQVVPLIAVFHFLVKILNIVEGFFHFRCALIHVSLCELNKLCSVDFQWLQL